MRKSIVLHIGANKTGSSAIQSFLALNVDVLRAQGVVVPDEEIGLAGKSRGFQVFAFEKLFKDKGGAETLANAIERIFEVEKGAHTLVLSAENLAANSIAPSLFSELVADYDIRLILYVRRQDDYLLSSWQQWYSKVSDDFWAWMTEVVGLMGNWRMYLERWERVIPREHITVRIYERSRLEGGDAIRDFYESLGLGSSFDSMLYPAKQVNPSFSDSIASLVAGNRMVFESAHDSRFYAFVQDVTGDRYVRNHRRSIITFSQRVAILKRYADANRWVKERYFYDMPGDLFATPRAEDYEYMSGDAVRAEQLEFLTMALFEMYKRSTR